MAHETRSNEVLRGLPSMAVNNIISTDRVAG